VKQQVTSKDANYYHFHAYKPRSYLNKASMIYSYNSFFQTFVPDCAQLGPQGCTAYLTAVLPTATYCSYVTNKASSIAIVTSIALWADLLAALHTGHQVLKAAAQPMPLGYPRTWMRGGTAVPAHPLADINA
jgi:hypothetical protein